MKTLLLYFLTFLYSMGLSAQVDSIVMKRFEGELSKKIDSISKHSIGKPFASFTVVSLDGKSYSEKHLIGKISMINFWFEDCPPCIKEQESLKKLYLKFKDNPNFQLISFTKDYPEVAKEAVRKHQIPYVVCPIATKECYRLNFNMGFPTNIVVDTFGNIVFFKTGMNEKEELKTFQEIDETITNLLNSSN